MYEPVMDRCVTTTIIKPNKHPLPPPAVPPSSTEPYSIKGCHREEKDLSPPEKPPRRYGRNQRHRLMSQESTEG